MSDAPLCAQLAERVTRYRLAHDDGAVVVAARRAIIDTVAVTLLGASASCTRIAAALPRAPGGAALAGRMERVSALDAAFINGIASHAEDFDDFTQAFGGHPSVPILPGLIALAQCEGQGGFAVMQAFVAGVELETRLAHAVHFQHYEKGWHPTATLGVFGAAASAARLLELDDARTAMALAIAASLASGVKANFGSMAKPLHIGQCARNGVQAALLARAGFDANPAVLESPQGFLDVYNGRGEYRVERLLEPWFSPPLILAPGLSVKQFACCGSTHPAIYMALELKERGLDASDLARVQVRTHPRRLPHTDNPSPSSGLEAKFSVQYCVARALVSGAPRLHHFEDSAIDDADVRALMSRVDVGAHPEMVADGEHAFGAEVCVWREDGSVERARTAHMPGRGAEHPMSEAELRAKFDDCARAVLAQDTADALWQRLLKFEELADLHDVLGEATPRADAAAQ